MSVQLAARVQRGEMTVDVSLAAERGTVTAIVGPNGAGKSTVLRAIAGLQPIDTGMVAIDGVTVDDGGDVLVAPQKRRVGVVFQDYLLFPHLSVRDNVSFGPRSAGLSRAQARALADVELERLKLTSLAARLPGQLSGGQAQRVALARALATRPSVLLLDEPMAALDVESRREVRALLASALTDFAGTTLLVSHDLRDALALASRLVVIEDGRVTQDAAIADVLMAPTTPYVRALIDEAGAAGRD